MKVSLFMVGKTEVDFVQSGLNMYVPRIQRYINFELQVFTDKNSGKLPPEKQKEVESQMWLDKIKSTDFLILLDENGKLFTSQEFAGYIEQRMINSVSQIIFVIGGAYGFSAQAYNRANQKISLSQLTFPHQLVRLIFAEQLYRAMTIIKGESYHHE